MAWQHAIVMAFGHDPLGLQFIQEHPRDETNGTGTIQKVLLREVLPSGRLGSLRPLLEQALLFNTFYGHTIARSPDDVIDPLATYFFPRPVITRLSKHGNWQGPTEPAVRHFMRVLFRPMSGAGYYSVPGRLLDDDDNPLPLAAADYERWSDWVVTSWGGTPSADPRLRTLLIRIP